MRVKKRDQSYEAISFDKVLRRVHNLSTDLSGVDADEIAQKVCARIYDGVSTSELDELAAQMCATLVTTHPDYGTLASRIIVSNHHKNTSPSFSETMGMLFQASDVHGCHNPLISDELWAIVQAHKEKLNSYIDYQRDYSFDYFGFKTLERAYLSKVNGRIVERPQHLWMRVALGIHGWDLKEALETYDLMSQRYFTHATPTLFNAGTPQGQLASCFLLGTHDSVRGMYKTIGDCGMISKYAGGIGVHVSNIRARGSHIRGTNGVSSGIIPMLRVYNDTARHINQAGKRLGSIAIYLEPWHADMEAFLEIRKNQGAEEERCRDLFTAMWIPDLFMKRVQQNGDWSLMCPDECPGLTDTYGGEFENLYEKYEADGKFRKKVKAQALWMSMIKSQIETGSPYLCYKDAVNQKTNQKNIGIIKSSNLCVAPETRILTKQGYKVIRDVANEEVEVWNGMEWSKTKVLKTNDDAELIRITFSDGNVLECTPYHKFYVQVGYNKKEIVKKDACELDINDRLIKWSPPEDVVQDNRHYVCVTSIEWTGRRDATYCFHEPKREMGVFNGVLTGNCSEIVEYSDENEYATCNLASIALPAFVKTHEDGTKTFDFEALHKISQTVTRNINKVIDRTFYPVPETERSNKRHRPIGLGVQGLADVYAMMRMPFDSPDAAQLNKEIFETIYHGAVMASVNIAKRRAELCEELHHPTITAERKEEIHKHLKLTPEEANLAEYKGAYATFKGSPSQEGKFQFDLWETAPTGKWDWNTLRSDMLQYGLRNSLLLAPMPTASTSQILGNTECMEPITSNIFQRQTLAGEFTIINKFLIIDLLALGLWSVDMKNRILAGGGSVQDIQEIPEEIRVLYKTAWELKQKVLIDQAADRGIYVCQSQSLNLFVEEPDINKVSNMHMYAWSKGLKTGIYYLRTRPKAKITAFTLDPTPLKGAVKNTPTVEEEPVFACRRDDPTCAMCSA